MAMIQNAKALQKKSRNDAVNQIGPESYRVCSGQSGNEYYVWIGAEGLATCSCKWGHFRKWGAGCGCHHVMAVRRYIAAQAERRVSFWTDPAQVARQHRSQFSIGDNVIVTSRVR